MDFLKIIESAFEPGMNSCKSWISAFGRKLLIRKCGATVIDKYGVSREENSNDIIDRVSTCVAAFEENPASYDLIRRALGNDMIEGRFMFDEVIMSSLGVSEGQTKPEVGEAFSSLFFDKYDLLKKEIHFQPFHRSFPTEFIKYDFKLGDTQSIEASYVGNIYEILSKYRHTKGLRLYFAVMQEKHSVVMELVNKIKIAAAKLNVEYPITLSLDITDPNVVDIINAYLPDKLIRIEIRLSEIYLSANSSNVYDNLDTLFKFISVSDRDPERAVKFLFVPDEFSNLHNMQTATPGEFTGYINLAAFICYSEKEDKHTFDTVGYVRQIRRAIHYLNIINNAYKTANPEEVYNSTNNLRLGLLGVAEVLITCGGYKVSDLIPGLTKAACLYSNWDENRGDLVNFEVENELREFKERVESKGEFDLITDTKYFGILHEDGREENELTNHYTRAIFTLHSLYLNYFDKPYNRIGEDRKTMIRIFRDVLNGKVNSVSVFSPTGSALISSIFGSTPSTQPFSEDCGGIFDDRTNTVYLHRNFPHNLISQILDVNGKIDKNKVPAEWYGWDRISIDDQLYVYKRFASFAIQTGNTEMNISSIKLLVDFIALLKTLSESNIRDITLVYNKGAYTMEEVTKDGNFEKELSPNDQAWFDNAVKNINDLRPVVIDSYTVKSSTPFGTLYLTLNVDTTGVKECFIRIGKTGSDIRAFVESIGRLLGFCLNKGIPIDECIASLDDVCGKEIWTYTDTLGIEAEVRSIPDCIAKMLKDVLRLLNKSGAERNNAE